MGRKRKVLTVLYSDVKSNNSKKIVPSPSRRHCEVLEQEANMQQGQSAGHKRGRGRKPAAKSTLRDAKYREKLKNSVNLLEWVLPLSKQARTRQNLYEDAIHFTALLQESLFHLVNCLRVQNQENIYNFAVLTPSYVQASFVDLIKEVEIEIKNGTQVNAQLVEKMSYLASEFFTGLVRKSSHHRQLRRFHDNEMKASVSFNNNSTRSYMRRQPLHTCFHQCA